MELTRFPEMSAGHLVDLNLSIAQPVVQLPGRIPNPLASPSEVSIAGKTIVIFFCVATSLNFVVSSILLPSKFGVISYYGSIPVSPQITNVV